MKLPILFHKGKTGALVQWEIWTEKDIIYVRHGQVGGKLQLTPGVTCTGKNIGKSNETTPEQQAITEAKSMWTYKVERKYSETKEDAQEEIFLPMLAKPFKDPKKPGVFNRHAKYPGDIQPKLDGARAVSSWEEKNIILGTRGGKEWEVPSHINEELEEFMPPDMVLDGELYIHGVDFDTISSWTKKKHPETTQLEYHVYDMPLSEKGINLPWKERSENLLRFFDKNAKKMKMVKYVETVGQAHNNQEVLDYETKCLRWGYEGCMFRNLEDKYLFGGVHCNSLLKVKTSVDDEFEIVDFTHGKGKYANCVKWWCITPEGNKFKVNPKTSIARKEELFKHGKEYIGQWLKVRYQNLSEEDRVPRFCRGLGFRDKRDM